MKDRWVDPGRGGVGRWLSVDLFFDGLILKSPASRKTELPLPVSLVFNRAQDLDDGRAD
jgi:hypothetical protein